MNGPARVADKKSAAGSGEAPLRGSVLTQMIESVGELNEIGLGDAG
jgi:hypothetical protein